MTKLAIIVVRVYAISKYREDAVICMVTSLNPSSCSKFKLGLYVMMTMIVPVTFIVERNYAII